MIDVYLPTTDGRTVILPRYTQPEPGQRMLLHALNLQLPTQPKPRISAAGKLATDSVVVQTFFSPTPDFEPLKHVEPRESAKTG